MRECVSTGVYLLAVPYPFSNISSVPVVSLGKCDKHSLPTAQLFFDTLFLFPQASTGVCFPLNEGLSVGQGSAVACLSLLLVLLKMCRALHILPCMSQIVRDGEITQVQEWT